MLRYGLSEEQQLIADSATKLFADLFTSTVLRAFMQRPEFSAEWRRLLGESGLFGVCAPPEVGGVGAGCVDALAVVRAAGRYIAPWPVAESIVAAALLSKSHPDVARAVIDADEVVAFAGEPLHVKRNGTNRQVAGTLDAVPWGSMARWMLLEVIADDERGWVLLDLESEHIARQTRKSIDPCCPMARVIVRDVPLDNANLLPADSRATELRTLFAAAEMLGAAQACLDLAVEYMKVRKQFGQPIGRFQALKHIAANDALYIESMRLAVEYAAWAHDAAAADAAMALHIAKEYCSQQARTVAEDSIQCHGGIGFTWEYDLHLYLRRILRLGASLGTATEHREAITAALIEQFA